MDSVPDQHKNRTVCCW